MLHLQAVCFCFFISLVSLQLKRKSARVASLEKQLQEKTSAYTQAALTNTELENQLLVQHTPSCFGFSHFCLVSYFLPDEATARHEELRVLFIIHNVGHNL